MFDEQALGQIYDAYFERLYRYAYRFVGDVDSAQDIAAETLRRLLEALRDGERCVCELQEVVGSDMSTVSKHLSVMKAAGLLEDRKEGLKVHYRLRVPCVLEFLDCIDAVLDPPAARSCVCKRPGKR